MRGGAYLIVINSGTGDGGVRDVSGNALDGNFYGSFPTGDGLAGGNFAASISTFHNNVVLAAVPVQDGYVSPGAVSVATPAAVKQAKKDEVVKAAAKTVHVRQFSKPATVHDAALAAFEQAREGHSRSEIRKSVDSFIAPRRSRDQPRLRFFVGTNLVFLDAGGLAAHGNECTLLKPARDVTDGGFRHRSARTRPDAMQWCQVGDDLRDRKDNRHHRPDGVPVREHRVLPSPAIWHTNSLNRQRTRR